MAYVSIKYKNFSFEENPGFITWLQLFLLRLLAEKADAPEWTANLVEEWELNVQIEVYKYFFDDELLDDTDKEKWAISFITDALTKLDNLSLEQFGVFINEAIDREVDYTRVKKILLNVLRMLQNIEPLATY